MRDVSKVFFIWGLPVDAKSVAGRYVPWLAIQLGPAYRRKIGTWSSAIASPLYSASPCHYYLWEHYIQYDLEY